MAGYDTHVGGEGLQHEPAVPEGLASVGGVGPGTRARLVHGHGAAPAGRRPAGGLLGVLRSAGTLPSQRGVLRLQGAQLKHRAAER